jgi:hypothetical protein
MEINNLIPSDTAKGGRFNNSAVSSNLSEGQIQQSASNSEAVTDELSVLADKLLIARQVITQQVNISLNISSSNDSTHYPNDTLQASQQSFNESLADKAMQKIQQEAVSNEHEDDDEHHDRAVKTVSILVQQGFERATTEINRLGINNTAVADQTAQAQSYVTQAIEQQATAPAEAQTTDTSSTSTVLNQASASRELTTSLQVTTREGDVVTINLSKAQELMLGNVQTETNNTVIATSSFNSSIEISIEGDLNKKEYESIKQIVEQVGEIAKKLFVGKTGAAMEKLGELEFNPRQLSDLTMNISSSISFQAMQAYTEISNIPVDSSSTVAPLIDVQPAQQSTSAQPETISSNSVQDSVQSPVTTAEPSTQESVVLAVSVARETTEVISQSVAGDIFENPFKELRNLFSMISGLFSANNQTHSSHNHFVKGLLEGLINSSEQEHKSHRHHRGHEDD